jgi:pimeloyl-ACP methyl ester carboxylesterase
VGPVIGAELMNAAWISKPSLIVAALALTLVAGCQTPGAHAPREGPSATRETACTDETMPAGFASDIAQVNGTTLHHVSGGQGPAVILIHGFPENWSAYAKIMPRLASRFRVVAIDLRGIGGSTPAEGGYDVATMAEDVFQLVRTLRLDRPYVVGHDLGGWVAYALARLHPDAVRGVMILDVPVAGVDPWDEVKVDPELWFFRFHNAPGLVAGAPSRARDRRAAPSRCRVARGPARRRATRRASMRRGDPPPRAPAPRP